VTAESEARRALQRLRRAAEKGLREADELAGALRHAEGSDFPDDVHDRISACLEEVVLLCEEEAQRLQEKILHAGGLEPGRIRRSSS